MSTVASPSLRYRNRSAASASRKYSDRRPRIANALLVNTMNGSVVTAKMAGMESTAKMRSVVSTAMSASSRGGRSPTGRGRDEEALAVEPGDDPQVPLREPDQRVLLGMRLVVLALEHHPDAREHQERAEHVDDPVVGLDERGAQRG